MPTVLKDGTVIPNLRRYAEYLTRTPNPSPRVGTVEAHEEEAELSPPASSPSSAPAPKWLTTKQVAQRLGVSAATVERIKAHAEALGITRVPWIYIRRCLRWEASRVDEFFRASSTWRPRRGRR